MVVAAAVSEHPQQLKTQVRALPQGRGGHRASRAAHMAIKGVIRVIARALGALPGRSARNDTILFAIATTD